jgi:hypothetical protein
MSRMRTLSVDRRSRKHVPGLLAYASLLTALLAASSLTAQNIDVTPLSPSAFLDDGARRLHEAARVGWVRVERDVLSYTALIRQRAAAELRLPLKDRTLFRAESAARVFWSRDGSVLVQAVGSRVWHPGVEENEDDEDFWQGGNIFDPSASDDRLSFGMMGNGRGDVWFAHPLARDAGDHYRFRTGDSLTISLPNGRQLRAVELQVLPIEAHYRRITGSLWIEPESGALIRAVYRLSKQLDLEEDLEEDIDEEDFRFVPGLFKPFTFDVTLVTVDYALWDLRVWMPRSLRVEGVAGAGIIKVPAAAELSYEMESVMLASNGEPSADPDQGPRMEERHFRTRSEALVYLAQLAGESGVAYERDDDADRDNGRSVRYLVPEDRSALARSPDLPPPIWEDGPGFMTGAQLDELGDVLGDLPVPVLGVPQWAFNWGPQRPDLLRYNRVEGPSVGARLQLRMPGYPWSLSTTGFLGLADREPKARMSLERETLSTKIAFGLYHELEPVSRNGRHLGVGNTVTSLLFGRDDGDYFMASGFDVRLTPPSAERRSRELRIYGEWHDPVETSTDFAVFKAFDGDWRFRDNVVAQELSPEVGASFVWSPWSSTDPLKPQVGFELFTQGAFAWTDSITFDYERASLTLRGAFPLPRRVRLGLELGAGESLGDLPAQRAWFMGGPQTLRGYPAASSIGPSFVRGRFEVGVGLAAISLAGFTDYAWTGQGLDVYIDERNRSLYSVGGGLSILDGVIRFDIAKGLRRLPGAAKRPGWRVDLYLDGIL